MELERFEAQEVIDDKPVRSKLEIRLALDRIKKLYEKSLSSYNGVLLDEDTGEIEPGTENDDFPLPKMTEERYQQIVDPEGYQKEQYSRFEGGIEALEWVLRLSEDLFQGSPGVIEGDQVSRKLLEGGMSS